MQVTHNTIRPRSRAPLFSKPELTFLLKSCEGSPTSALPGSHLESLSLKPPAQTHFCQHSCCAHAGPKNWQWRSTCKYSTIKAMPLCSLFSKHYSILLLLVFLLLPCINWWIIQGMSCLCPISTKMGSSDPPLPSTPPDPLKGLNGDEKMDGCSLHITPGKLHHYLLLLTLGIFFPIVQFRCLCP